MTLKAFFIDALTSALDLGLGTSDDVLRHATPDVLATHLPRPLWARLLTACLGASRVDAQLVVETIGLQNLCEHVPQSIMWLAIRDIAARALGQSTEAGARTSVLAPPPDARPASPPAASPAPLAVGPAIPSPGSVSEPLADLIQELEADAPPPERTSTLRPRSATSQRFRPSNTAATRLGAARRPQAIATPVPAPPPPEPTPAPAPSAYSGRQRRDPTQSEEEIETRVGDGQSEWGGGGNGAGRDSGRAISVDDSQLVDWQANTDGSGTTALSDEDFSDLGPKR